MGIIKKGVQAGAGLAALAAVAGAYFLYGKDAAKNRRRVQGWALKVKGDVLERLEGLKAVNEEAYHRIVDQAAAKYDKLRAVNKAEFDDLVRELKSTWTHLKGHVVAPPAKAAKKRR